MARTSPMTGRKKTVLWLLTILFPVLLVAFLYFAALTARASYAYYQFKVKQHVWVGNAWAHDPELGYYHVPNFRGEQSLGPGVTVPIWTDGDGYRIPADNGATDKPVRPLVLALGDSTTFGAACPAETTYAYLVAEALGGSVVNTAVSGHGLAQMLILARRVIPQLKPDVVLVASGDHFWTRATTGFAPTRLAAIPMPYIVGEDGGQLVIQSPRHRPVVFGSGLDRHWSSKQGVGDFLSFLTKVIPILAHSDVTRNMLRIQWGTGWRTRPPEFDPGLVRQAYVEMAELTQRYGGRAVIVDIGMTGEPDENHLRSYHGIPGVVDVHAMAETYSRIPVKTSEEWRRVYSHWVGDPPVLVDPHPNAIAHRIMADEILQALKNPAGSE